MSKDTRTLLLGFLLAVAAVSAQDQTLPVNGWTPLSYSRTLFLDHVSLEHPGG